MLRHPPTDPSIEQVAALASQNALPIPRLDLSSFRNPADTAAPSYNRGDTMDTTPQRPHTHSPAPAYSSDDPWQIHARGSVGTNNGAPSSLEGTGLPKEWWKRQERVNVNLLGPQGFILNRYMTYEIASEVSMSNLPFSRVFLTLGTHSAALR